MSYDTNSPLFLIVIPTFKRHSLLRETIASVIRQSYAGWRIIISDSGNTLTERDIAGWYPEFKNKIKMIQYGGELSADVHWHKILKVIAHEPEDYFLFLGDDDVLTMDCLKSVAQVAGPKLIACNVATYFENKSITTYNDFGSRGVFYDLNFDGSLSSCMYKHGCDVIENGRRVIGNVIIPSIETHISGYFISLGILRSILEKYGTLWVRPFGDVGLGLAIQFAGFVRLILKPLVVIRRHENNGGMAFIDKNRMRLVEGHVYKFIPDLPNVICFNLFSALSYVDLLNKLNLGLSIRPRAWFYFVCARQVLGDGYFNKSNWGDILKIYRHGFASGSFWATLIPDTILYFARRLHLNKKTLLATYPTCQISDALSVIENRPYDK